MGKRRILHLIVFVGAALLFFNGAGNPSQQQSFSDSNDSMYASINSVYSLKSNSTKKAMLCTVVKDPHSRYITEWVDYHFALGFNRIKLYDNSENFNLENWGRDKSYSGQVDRIHFLPGVTHTVENKGGAKFQSAGFMDCARTAKDLKYDWVMGLDIDEFLMIKKPNVSIVDFMDQYCIHPCGQLSFNWLMFSSGGRKEYKPVPVTRRFTERDIRPAQLVKGIADPKALDLEKEGFWMHTWVMTGMFERNRTRTWIDTKGNELRQYKNKPLNMMMNNEYTEDAAVIHHYKLLSEGEWHEKNCERKDLNGYNVKANCEGSASSFWYFRDKKMINDPSAWERLKMLVPEYARYDKLNDVELG